MRTLKKTLALVLVVVMVVSFGAIGASADFKDVTATTDYYEAITLLTGMGVIDGVTDETFKPAGELTREQAVKIVSFIKLGPDSAKLISKATNAPFEDVGITRWSSGFVAYCANTKIVEGVTNKTFNPAGVLTSAAFTKMLLVAVGFDADATGLNGSSWAINTALTAKASGIFDNNIGVSPEKAITRAEACQLALLALDYSKTGSTVVYVVKDAAGVVLYSGSDALTALAIKSTAVDNILTTMTNNSGSLGDSIFGLTKTSSLDAFGRASTVYTNGKTGSAKVVYAKFAPKAVKSFTAETTYGKIVSALGYTKTGEKVTLNITENGGTALKVENVNRVNATEIGAQGTLIEVYKTGTDTYSVIVIDTYVKKLGKNDIKAATAATSKDDAKLARVVIDGMEYATSAFKADDVVLYTKTDNEIVNVVKADAVSGYVTAVATVSNYFRVDGVATYLSANSSLVIGSGLLVNSATQVKTFYYDSYGNVIYVQAGEAAVVATKHAYVIQTAAKAAESIGGGLFEEGDTTAAVAQAKILDLETGTIKVVNRAVVKGTDNKYYYANANGAASSVAVTDQKADTDKTYYGVCSYATLDNGDYVLVAKTTTNKTTITKNSANVTMMDGSKAVNLYANSKTVLKIVNCTSDKNGDPVSATISTATGIANFPAGSNEYNAIVTYSGGIVSEILVVQPKSLSTAVNYAVYSGEGETDANGTKHSFFVGGELVQYYVGKDVELSLNAGDVVGLTLTDGVIAKAADAAVQTEKGTALAVSYIDDSYVIAGGQVYYFTDNCVVVDANNAYAIGELDVDVNITVYGSETSKIAFIVIDKIVD